VGCLLIVAVARRRARRALLRQRWEHRRGRRPASERGDDVELVALRIGEARPRHVVASGISLAERYAIHDVLRPFGAPPGVLDRFPSRLHVNLVPRMQGRGTGRRLVMALISSLRDHDSRGGAPPGSPLQPAAIGFYRHIGFTEPSATGVHIFGMDLLRQPSGLCT
jgi:GNAT superfamily N-acetyltransferase